MRVNLIPVRQGHRARPINLTVKEGGEEFGSYVPISIEKFCPDPPKEMAIEAQLPLI
jgi:hypothetical protein